MTVKSLQDLAPIVRRRLGLIVGPSATLNPAYLGGLNRALERALGVPATTSYIAMGDAFLKEGGQEPALREAIRTSTATEKASAMLSSLAAARWNAVLSFSLDRHLESALQLEANKVAGGQQIAAIDDLMSLPPARSLPVYKLLGSVNRDDFAVSTASYIERRSAWRFVLRAFADHNRGAPVLCLGVSECEGLFLDLLGEMRADPVTLPTQLLVLDSEPLGRTQAVVRLLGPKRLIQVHGTVGELIRVGYESRAAARKPSPQTGAGLPGLSSLSDQQDVATIVNLATSSDIPALEHQRLLSLLFSPSLPAWDPFVHGLDFQRDASTDLLNECREALQSEVGDTCVVLRGPASSGKTVLLKRAALELAKQGEVVLWLKPWAQPDTKRALTHFFKSLAGVLGKKPPKVAIFADDPPTLGVVAIADALAAADAAGLESMVVAGVRASDWDAHRARVAGPIPPRAQVEVPVAFTNAELQRFPAYLVKIRAAATMEEALTMASNAATSYAADILATLWWLLPETRAIIAESVREEYFRLGDTAALSRVIIGQTEATSELLQRAYRMVSVAEAFRQPLPLEVLVSALGVDYGQWLAHHGVSDGAYGLIYTTTMSTEEADDPGTTIYYRTRTSVVANIVVNTINGGTTSHGGELEVLRTMLAACTGSQPAYREFCLGVLTRLEDYDWLEYREGLKLFDTVTAALPFRDKTVAHQRAIWIRKRGHDPLSAIAALKDALSTPNYPNVSRGEADEHIYTSLARATLDGMDLLRIEFEAGKGQVLSYLSKARSATFFNPGAAHVQASLVMTLLDKTPRDHAADYFYLLNTALADIDRALILLRAPRAYRPEADREDREMLHTARMQLLARAPLTSDLRREADVLWDTHRSQDGFVFVVRQLLDKAHRDADRGSAYKTAFDYAHDRIAFVERSQGVPAAGLLEAALHVYYTWRIHRDDRSGSAPVDWLLVHGLSDKLLRVQKFAQDPLYLYIAALALAHMGRWADAHACFQELRRRPMPKTMLHATRDSLLDSNGNSRTVQGIVRRSGERTFIACEELQTDVQASARTSWPADGSIVHARVEFGFAGPTAIQVVSG